MPKAHLRKQCREWWRAWADIAKKERRRLRPTRLKREGWRKRRLLRLTTSDPRDDDKVESGTQMPSDALSFSDDGDAGVGDKVSKAPGAAAEDRVGKAADAAASADGALEAHTDDESEEDFDKLFGAAAQFDAACAGGIGGKVAEAAGDADEDDFDKFFESACAEGG